MIFAYAHVLSQCVVLSRSGVGDLDLLDGRRLEPKATVASLAVLLFVLGRICAPARYRVLRRNGAKTALAFLRATMLSAGKVQV